MIETLLEPFAYSYMARAIWVSALVGGVCAFLSCYLVLKGWSLMGDALSHAVVPGVAVAYLAKLPYAAGAFASGLLAAVAMAMVQRITVLREDAVIGLVFTTMFAAGLLIVSVHPASVSVQTIVMGNVLAIADEDVVQVVAIAGVSLAVLLLRWRDMMLAFFDASHARAVGLDPWRMRVLFFVLLSACTVAALQTVGAILVIAMVVTPGATAYLLTDRFGRMLALAVAIGAVTAALGAYVSYFLDGATGGLVVVAQTLVFLAAFVFAPKHGRLAGAAQGAGVIEWIAAPLAHEFMVRGLIVAVLVGAGCAVLSCYLVLKGWSLMGDAVSHAVLPGIVLAFLGGLPMKLGALAAGLGCALATGYIRRNSRVREDAVLAIVFAGMFALGLVLFVKVDTDQHLNHVLFGNVLGVGWWEVAETAAVMLPVVALALARRRDLFLVCFDPGHARAIGLSARRLELALLAGLALVIVAALSAAGIVLVVAMLIAPGAIGFVATRRFDAMMAVAAAVSVAACVAGVLASFHLDVATAPLIVVIQAACFLPALWIGRRMR